MILMMSPQQQTFIWNSGSHMFNGPQRTRPVFILGAWNMNKFLKFRRYPN